MAFLLNLVKILLGTRQKLRSASAAFCVNTDRGRRQHVFMSGTG